MHEHFDAEGRRTGHTVITRESEWDEETRARALTLAEFENNQCPCGCGQSIAVATDERRAFRVQTFKCLARRAIKQHERAEADKAEQTKRPKGWDDGITYYIDESFVRDVKKAKGASND